MSSRNRPKSNNRNGLTWNGGRPRGAAPGSASAGNAPAPPKASSPALLHLFAPATSAAAHAVAGGFGGLAADVDALVAPFEHLSHDAVVGAVQTAAAAPAARLWTRRASIRSGTGAAVSGPDVEPDVLPAAGAVAYVGRRVEVLAAADRTRSFTPLLGDLVAG